MSNKKSNKGRFFHKLHQLQKRVTRWLGNDQEEKVKMAEVRERKLLEKIKGR